jgi:hypothetical protein
MGPKTFVPIKYEIEAGKNAAPRFSSFRYHFFYIDELSNLVQIHLLSLLTSSILVMKVPSLQYQYYQMRLHLNYFNNYFYSNIDRFIYQQQEEYMDL